MNRNGKGTVLVIDDEEIMREILETLLTRDGYQVRLAANGAEGLALVRAMSFDAAIVDMMMPGMDGISTLDEIKKLDDDLPVLMITAFASVENAISAMKPAPSTTSPSRSRTRKCWSCSAMRWRSAGWWPRTRPCARTSRRTRTASARSSAAARACGRCSI
jgi:CheY-like chemotaxis protein